MKKNKLKIYLKYGILMLGISIFLTNCQKDDDQFQTKIQSDSNIKISTLRKTEIEKDKRLIGKIRKLKTDIKTKSNGSTNNRDVYNSEYDFTINTDYAKHIDNGINHTYTFPIYREQDNGLLENLLLIEQDDNTFKTYIVQYEFTQAEITAINFKQKVDIENKVTFIEINDNGFSDDIFGKYYYNGNCYEDNYVYQSASNCSAGGNHSFSDGAYSESNPNGCHAWGTIDMATSGGYVNIPTLVSCDGGGGNPSNGGNPPDYNPTNPNNNPHGGGSSGSPTTPITCRTCPELENPIDSQNNDPNCQNLNQQSQDSDFTDKLKDLRDNISPTDETGYVQVPADANATSYNYNPVQGTNGQSINITVTPGLISGYYHTHFNIENQLSVFSMSDLWSLYELVRNGHIFDDTFTMVLITAHGTKYALKFTDPQAFVDFGDEWLVDWDFSNIPLHLSKRAKIEDIFENDYGIKPRDINKNHKNEKKFAKFLSQKNLGMELFKSNNDFTQWEKVNPNGNTTPCN